MRSVRTWLLYVILLTGMVYSALALTAKPVYAAGCNCQQAQSGVLLFCSGHGGVGGFWCTNGAQTFTFFCRDGEGGTVGCP